MQTGSSPSPGRVLLFAASLIAALNGPAWVSAQTPLPPAITAVARASNQVRLGWTPYPAAQQYHVLSGTNLSWPLLEDANGVVQGYTWSAVQPGPAQFFKLGVTPLASNALLTANVLNRLAYGPTPDDLERVTAMTPQAYIDEQLAPESLPETLHHFVAVTTNSVALASATNWSLISVTGTVSSSTLFVWLSAPGEAYLDDVQLRLIQSVVTTNLIYDTNNVVIGTNYLTNTFLGSNVLVNGDFESPLTTGWTVSTNLTNSSLSTNVVCSGNSSLHLVASAPGTGQSSALWQTVTPALPTANSPKCVLSFWYLPSPTSRLIFLRLSGSGTIISALDQPPAPQWIYATATGIATTSPTLYIYPSGSGETYLDDLKLVAGSVPEAGPNLLRNGDFELPLTNGWQLTADFTNSFISTNLARSGRGSLKMVATGAGSGSGDAVFQGTIAGLTNGATYTLSFWYIPSTRGRTLTARLGGSGTPGLLSATPDTTPAGLYRRLETLNAGHPDSAGVTSRTLGGVGLADLRAWFVMNAVGARRQLVEVLSQFLENHFVTQHSKSRDYLDRFYDDSTLTDKLAADWEYREQKKWRAALLRPDCTFHDLLKISAESPAMIVYLDTVDSRADARTVANENYARELFELFCMGVDNGYEQNDIVAQSRAWTGWSVGIVDPANADNPLAQKSSTYGFYPGVGVGGTSNLIGVWAFNYNSSLHGTNRAPLLSVWSTNSTSTNLIALGPKRVPDRFGPPWAGTPYQLVIPALPSRATGTTNGLQDGYDVLGHLATNVPMTAEYISVKLCRLFIHDNFPNPTTRPELTEYSFYDYRRPDLSAEAQLVHDCMLAWWNSAPRGNLRAVLQTIFNSELFRSHGGSLQKIKTPLEYSVSMLRALRSDLGGGVFTAGTDGYSLSSPLNRMGTMLLFDRDAPDGYPEEGSPWISAGTLAERVRYVQASLIKLGDANRSDAGNNFTDPVALLKRKLPAASWNNAGDVADYFLSILYPAEGKANLDLCRTLAIAFLNTADNGTTSSPFVSLGSTSTTYDTRVRGVVAMLMTLPRFQEQ